MAAVWRAAAERIRIAGCGLAGPITRGIPMRWRPLSTSPLPLLHEPRPLAAQLGPVIALSTTVGVVIENVLCLTSPSAGSAGCDLS